MFISNNQRRSRRADANKTERFFTGKMSLCRACLMLLGPQDTMHDLHNEKDLALKFLACTGYGLDALLPPQNEEMHVVLKCICETCYQLVQKFHDFQRMCKESLQNFEKLLLEASPTDSEKDAGTAHQTENTETQLPNKEESEIVETNNIAVSSTIEAIEDIEEVYILEDEATKEAQATSFVVAQREENTIAPSTMLVNRVITRRRGQRQTLDCTICLRRFYKASLFEAHMQNHEGEHPYSCVHCGKNYARANLLYMHLREAHRNITKSYSCTFDNCDKVYKAQRSLKFHVSQQHPQSLPSSAALPSPHMCDKCGKTYARIGHLKRHKWVHMSKGERPFGCETCGQRFYTKQFLADHLLRRHSNKQLLRCNKCGRIAPTRAALVAHKKAHKSITSRCDICKINFSTMSNLRAHQRTMHAKLRPHACDFCAARFAKRQHLENHEMRHTGERKYKCVPCKQAFIQKVAYKRHMCSHKIRDSCDKTNDDLLSSN